ncbi:hypothetical protein HYC85_020462 [Camellia sinensis]|uniref:Uncharacterized protein n=1 Tax=Camellia sinensis TaxID=4442 RepID=A0A7J7GQ37_CAMSI|nr:hypothetical protein HYC85_020462 [Camellia sinensis]
MVNCHKISSRAIAFGWKCFTRVGRGWGCPKKESLGTGSEKIGWLQLEVQKIHYVLLKLLDEKKNNEKSRFSRSKTTTILRDFIHSGRSSPRRKKAGLFGCFRLPTNGDSNNISSFN